MGKADTMTEIAQPLVTVIVPVYKVEPYLRRCIDSIISQTYHNLEIILVDDGSPDGCPEICDEYAERDSRIKVIHKKNGGLSDARNVGLGSSSGKYVTFVDSDDWLENAAVDYMYQLIIKYDAGLVIGGMQRVENITDYILKSDWNGKLQEACMTNVQAMQHFFQNGCAAWARLYRRSIFNDIMFPIGEINEDEAIVLPILERCGTVVLTNHVIYNYRCRPESITTASFSATKLAWQRHCADNLRFIQEKYPELEADAAARYRGSLLWSLTEIALSDGDWSEQVRELRFALRKYHALFKAAPFTYSQDKIRLEVLTWLPFPVYRTLIRLKRRK